MRNILTYGEHALNEGEDQSRRDFLTGLVTTIGLIPLTGWGVYRIIRSLFDDYSGVDNTPRWATGLRLSEPGWKFLAGVYKSDPGHVGRAAEVEEMLHREFAQLERDEEEVELTQKMYDAIVLAGVRVGAEALYKSAFLASVKSGDFDQAARAHEWLEGGALEGDALERAVEFERDLFLSRKKIRPVKDVAFSAGNGAEILRDALNRLGYEEKENVIDSAGPIDPGLARAVALVLSDYREEMPNVQVVVTAGNDRYHRRFRRTQHRLGLAEDLVIRPYNRENADALIDVLEDHVSRDPRLKYVDEYRFPSKVATGGHFHLQYNGR